MNFSSPWTELFGFVFAFIFSSLPFDGRHLWEYQKPCHHQTQGDNVRKPSYQGLILFFQWFINFNFSLLAKWTFYFQQEREFKANCLFGMLGWKDSYLISILFTIILFFFPFYSAYSACDLWLPFWTYPHAVFPNCAVCLWLFLQFVNVSLN